MLKKKKDKQTNGEEQRGGVEVEPVLLNAQGSREKSLLCAYLMKGQEQRTNQDTAC